MSFWKDLQDYIYTTALGEIIRRAELVKMFPEYATGRQGSTLDTYRRMLTVVGVLDETGTPGVYKRGYVTLPPVYSKSYTAEQIKKLYVHVPYHLLNEKFDWSFWERMVYQHFKPKSLLDEFYEGMRVEHDPNSLGFRFYRVKCWNTCALIMTKLVETLNDKDWSDSRKEEAIIKSFNMFS